MNEDKMRYAAVIPLIGGMVLGNRQALGSEPEFFASYDAFAGNERFLWEYMPGVPRHALENMDYSKHQGLDMVSTVCPCAGLSMLNNSKTRGADAPQNEWMYKSARAVLEGLSPTVFWGENAPGLYSFTGKGVAEKLYRIGKDRGYSFSMVRTSTNLHGVPQNRMRTFYFFWKSDRAPLMGYYRREKPHLVDYLRQIPEWATGQEPVSDADGSLIVTFLNRMGLKEEIDKGGSSARMIFRLGLYEEFLRWLKGDSTGWDHAKADMAERTVRKFQFIKGKLDQGKSFWDGFPHFFPADADEVGPVTGRSMMSLLHPTERRPFTSRELMHLMGMPHDFQLDDMVKDLFRVTQNVPVCTARDWTLEVKKFIRGELPLSDTDFLRQNNCTMSVEKERKEKTKKLF